MSARGGAALYTPEILALAVELADYPLSSDLPLRGEAHSRVCGSRVAIAIEPAAEGKIARIGARVSACAIGQAAAALFLRSAPGRTVTEIANSLGELETWLADREALPGWPGLAKLEAARPYSARHAAILLPWKAALAALCNPPRSG